MALTLAACGSRIPSDLVGTWTQKDTRTDPERIEVSADSLLSLTLFRQVGKEGSELPIPTYCYYRLSGRIRSFADASSETVSYYTGRGREAPQYEVEFSVERIELLESSSNSTGCPLFIERQTEKIEQNKLNLALVFNRVSADTLLDPVRSTQFIKQ
jgi:hypothetical protein